MNRLLAFLSIALFSIWFSNPMAAQDELSVEFEYDNLSNAINDGIIDAKVTGGTAPYTYKWSEQKASLQTAKLKEAGEGISYTLTVTDANGKAVT
ncbi:MAG: SprB repeat-containing protein, partial [Flavobacteriales bacterium]